MSSLSRDLVAKAEQVIEACHRAEPLFQSVPPITLFSSLKSFGFRLWDEQREKMVGFSALRKMRPSMASKVPAP